MGYYLYMHTTPNGKRYVGITKQKPERRWGNGDGYRTCNGFFNAITKYGWTNISHEVILSDLSKEEAEYFERLFIAMFRTANTSYGYNCQHGGNLGKVFSDETRKKLSESHKGVRNSQYGKHHTIETRRKMSEANSGENCVWFGCQRSEESCAKMKASKRKVYGKPVKNLDTGEIFPSVIEAAEKYGISRPHIGNCCRGVRKTCGGYRWEYA